MRKVAIPGAIVQSTVATVLGVLLAQAAGWSLSAGVVFGATPEQIDRERARVHAELGERG